MSDKEIKKISSDILNEGRFVSAALRNYSPQTLIEPEDAADTVDRLLEEIRKRDELIALALKNFEKSETPFYLGMKNLKEITAP